MVDLCGRHSQVGSLAGAAHLLNDNAGVLRWAQWEQKSHVDQKGKSSLDFDLQYDECCISMLTLLFAHVENLDKSWMNVCLCSNRFRCEICFWWHSIDTLKLWFSKSKVPDCSFSIALVWCKCRMWHGVYTAWRDVTWGARPFWTIFPMMCFTLWKFEQEINNNDCFWLIWIFKISI